MSKKQWFDDRLERLLEDSGPLQAIAGVVAPIDWYETLSLVFEHGALRLSCVDDTDEIVVAAASPDPRCSPVRHPVLVGLAGTEISDAWWMTNHRGFSDAFQIRFFHFQTRVETTVQFEVGASQMCVLKVDAAFQARE